MDNRQRKKRRSCKARIDKLTAKNMELLVAVEKLAVAIENHKLNSVIATEVDRELWKTASEVVVFEDE